MQLGLTTTPDPTPVFIPVDCTFEQIAYTSLFQSIENVSRNLFFLIEIVFHPVFSFEFSIDLPLIP